MRIVVAALALSGIALTATLTGCGSDPVAQDSMAKPMTKMADNVSILAKVTGQQIQIENSSLAIIDQAAFDEMGLSSLFMEQGVKVDFAKHSVVLFSLGQQPTGGYSADIIAMQIKGDDLFVQGTAIAPSESDITTQVITYPFCAVAVAKLDPGLTLRSDITSLP